MVMKGVIVEHDLFNVSDIYKAWVKFKNRVLILYVGGNLNVEQWFDKYKFNCDSFRDISRLLTYKKAKKVKISVVIPTLNEEDNVGNVIRAIKESLMDKYPLVDELIVMDSGSTDKTQQIVEKAGAKFYLADSILKRHTTVLSGKKKTKFSRGKGENMWKALYVTKGDILCYIDADIKNIHPRFVYGLVGPLLIHEKIGFTKAFYQRPILVGKSYAPLGGGRVTELLIRPLFNMYFPRLSGYIQPLSGECAGRRELFERIPFFSAYGVETAMLIDLQKKFGLRACAQVDLKRRVHRNQTLQSLSKMAYGILGVFSRRANTLGKLILVREVKQKLRLIVKEKGDYKIEELQINDTQRPPMITIKEYRKMHKKDPSWLYV